MADEDDVQALEAQFFAQLQTRTSSVNQSLRASKPVEALRVALQDAPLASKDASLKQANYELILTALQSVAQNDDQIRAFLEICDADSADVLMKYLYRGLRTPENSATLLKFHAMLLEKAGMGCIVRAIVDRKTA
jgi:hypothetical protein